MGLEKDKHNKCASGGCSPRYFVLRCSCSVRVVVSGCMRRGCVECKQRVSMRRAASVRDSLEAGRGSRPVIYTVFTVPPHVRAYYQENPREWVRIRKEAWAYLKGIGGVFAVESTHPVGDDDPLEFHPHLNFLWVSKGDPFLNQEALRAAWVKILQVPFAVAWTQYSAKSGKIAHWARYVVRSFPGNPFEEGRVRWFGKKPKLPPVQRICPDCESRWIFECELKPFEYAEWMHEGVETGSDPPWLREIRKKLWWVGSSGVGGAAPSSSISPSGGKNGTGSFYF